MHVNKIKLNKICKVIIKGLSVLSTQIETVWHKKSKTSQTKVFGWGWKLAFSLSYGNRINSNKEIMETLSILVILGITNVPSTWNRLFYGNDKRLVTTFE